MKYTVLKARRVVTVSDAGTIQNGAVAVADGKIAAVGRAEDFGSSLAEMEAKDFGDAVLMPGLVDCHSHLLEYAAAAIHPVTPETHTDSVSALLLHALSCGLVAVGDHICGFPGYEVPYLACLEAARKAKIRVRAALCTITLGGEPLANFSAVTGARPIGHGALLDPEVLDPLIRLSDFPGENVFLTATPGNLPLSVMPNAGKLVYTQAELDRVAGAYHAAGKKLGAHVGGAEGIEMALNAGIDVIHHGHGMTPEQMRRTAEAGVPVVDTPMGGTHLQPNTPEQVLRMVDAGIAVSIATDAYLPAPENLPPLTPGKLSGPEALMAIAAPALKRLRDSGRDENACLALLTKNPAAVLGLTGVIGSLAPGYDADLIAAEGLPALEITEPEKIKAVYRRGSCVIAR